MNQISKIAVVLLAVASMVAVPYAVASDSSDAYDITVGETGATFSLENMKTEDIDRLFSDTNKLMFRNAFTNELSFVSPMWVYYSFSDVTFSDMDYSKSKSIKVTEDSVQMYDTTKTTYTIKMTAALNPALASYVTETFSLNHFFSKDLITAFGNQKPTADTKFEFTAVVTDVSLVETKYSYVVTDAMSFAITNKEQMQVSSYSVSSDVKYTRMVESQLKTDSFKIEMSNDVDNSFNTEFDYGSIGATKALSDTPVFMKSIPEDQCSNRTYSFNYGDVSSSGNLKFDNSANFYTRDGGRWIKATSADFLVSSNVQAKPILFYSDGAPTSIFDVSGMFNSATVTDSTLKTNDAMKAFLSTAGTTSEEYKDSVSASTDLFDEYEVTMKESDSGDSNVIFYVIIGVLAVIIAVLVLMMLLSAKKQRSTIRTR